MYILTANAKPREQMIESQQLFMVYLLKYNRCLVHIPGFYVTYKKTNNLQYYTDYVQTQVYEKSNIDVHTFVTMKTILVT